MDAAALIPDVTSPDEALLDIQEAPQQTYYIIHFFHTPHFTEQSSVLTQRNTEKMCQQNFLFHSGFNGVICKYLEMEMNNGQLNLKSVRSYVHKCFEASKLNLESGKGIVPVNFVKNHI